MIPLQPDFEQILKTPVRCNVFGGKMAVKIKDGLFGGKLMIKVLSSLSLQQKMIVNKRLLSHR